MVLHLDILPKIGQTNIKRDVLIPEAAVYFAVNGTGKLSFIYE